MPERDNDEFDGLIGRSSLGTPGARALRGRTTLGQVDAARARLADLLVEQGDVAGLQARADAGDRFSAYRLAEALAARGDVDEAIRLLRPHSHAGDQNAAELLAELLATQGDVDEAIRLLQPQAEAGDEQAVNRLVELLAKRAKAGDTSSAHQLAELLAELFAGYLAEDDAQYPLIERRTLKPPPRTGLMGMGTRRRAQDEIPAVHEHQALVYYVGGDYILGNARLGLAHEQVVSASGVSLVDVRHRVPVLVRFTIPSADASEFEVHVTFACTVIDPVTVVRDGLIDVESALRGYLESHHKLFELGLGYRMADINDVRITVNAQVKAYTTIRPLVLSGMSISMASVRVLTPAEVAEFERDRRKPGNKHTLVYRLDDHELVDHKRSVAAVRQSDEYDRDEQKARYDQLIAAELLRDAERREFERRELGHAMDMIGDDPRQALHMAFGAGQLDAGGPAKEFRDGDDRDRQIEETRVDRARAEEVRRLEYEREEQRQNRVWQREDRVRKISSKQEERQRLHDAAVRGEIANRLIRSLATRGNFDMVNIGLERLLSALDDDAGRAGPQTRDLLTRPSSSRGTRRRAVHKRSNPAVPGTPSLSLRRRRTPTTSSAPDRARTRNPLQPSPLGRDPRPPSPPVRGSVRTPNPLQPSPLRRSRLRVPFPPRGTFDPPESLPPRGVVEPRRRRSDEVPEGQPAELPRRRSPDAPLTEGPPDRSGR